MLVPLRTGYVIGYVTGDGGLVAYSESDREAWYFTDKGKAKKELERLVSEEKIDLSRYDWSVQDLNPRRIAAPHRRIHSVRRVA